MLKYLLASVASAGVLALAGCEAPSTIGGHEVPSGLTCQEDEGIWFDQSAEKVLGDDGRMGYPLGCVHIDTTPPTTNVTVCSVQPELCGSDN